MKNQISKIENEIKTVENEIKEIQNKMLKASKIEEIQKLTTQLTEKNNELKTLNTKKSNIEKNMKELEKIKGLSYNEVIQKIENKEIKGISKKQLKELKRLEILSNLENEVKIYKNLNCNTSGIKTSKGLMLQNDDNTYYCIAYNHIAVKSYMKDNKLYFEFNNNHEKFTGTSCVNMIKEFIRYTFDVYQIDYLKFFTENPNDLNLYIFKESLTEIIEKLANSYIDLKNMTLVNNNYKELSINKKVDSIIKELIY